MTKIKLCGMRTLNDIENVNVLRPEFIGFVFARESKRYITFEEAADLKRQLEKPVQAVGVFVNENLDTVASCLQKGVIDLAQLHGQEPEDYIIQLKKRTGKPVIRAFRIRTEEDLMQAEQSPADYILLDSGAGGGRLLDWDLLTKVKRPYFLAGGLKPDNVEAAIRKLYPYAVDVSSGIETDGRKDAEKMRAFTRKVRTL